MGPNILTFLTPSEEIGVEKMKRGNSFLTKDPRLRPEYFLIDQFELRSHQSRAQVRCVAKCTPSQWKLQLVMAGVCGKHTKKILQ